MKIEFIKDIQRYKKGDVVEVDYLPNATRLINNGYCKKFKPKQKKKDKK